MSETPEKKPETPKATSAGKKKKQVLKGGVVCKHLQEGHGPLAKRGKKVGIYYKGTLQKGGRQDV